MPSTPGSCAATGRLTSAAAASAADADYKALVCVFLYGGNDGLNTVCPTGNSSSPNSKTPTASPRLVTTR